MQSKMLGEMFHKANRKGFQNQGRALGLKILASLEDLLQAKAFYLTKEWWVLLLV